MSNDYAISQTERFLLIGLMVLICLTFYFHLATLRIEKYNENIRVEQAEKLYKANTPPNERFSVSHCFWSPPLITRFYLLQFFTNPFLLLILWKPTHLKLSISLVINFFITSSLFIWINREYSSIFFNELYKHDLGGYSYFSLTSHVTSSVLALLLIASIIIQTWLLIRFTIERFQAKLSLK